MKHRQLISGTVLGVLCIALVAVLLAAGASPVTAQGNAPVWVQFNVGRPAPDEGTSHVSVVLRDQASCKGGFEVYTCDCWNYWGSSEMGPPLGKSDEVAYGIHMWSGKVPAGAYYVKLGSGADPACVVGVSGNNVTKVETVARGWTPQPAAPILVPAQASQAEPAASPRAVAQPVMPQPIAAQPAAAQPAPVQPAAPAPVIAAAPRAERPLAEAKPNVWMPVPSNEPTMFEFYVGKVPDDDTSNVGVVLYSGPFRAGRFEIFTAEGKPFYRPEPGDWFGASESEDGKYASWHGDLVPGVYYVLVYPEGMRDCMLSVSGQSVTF